MESFFVRYRNFLVLLAVLLAQMIGLAMQVRLADSGHNSLDLPDGKGVRLIRLWAEAMVAPPERFFHDSKLDAGLWWQNYVNLGHVRDENRDLQKTIDRLRLEQAELLEDAKEGQRLQALLGFQQKYVYKTLAAQDIGSSGSDASRVFYIDKGSADGLVRDMAVVTPDGIVGKVRDVFPHTAQVLVVNDQTSGAGVILETTRTRGILRGNAQGRLQVEGLLSDPRIQRGEKVLTAGGDMIFPRGLPVGVVEGVVPDPDRDSFIDVIVKPAAHLDRLDEVLVITSFEPGFPPGQQHDLATSVALKGADAQAIKEQQIREQQIKEQQKEQQKASDIMAERLPGLTNPNAPAPNPAATLVPGKAAQPGPAQATPAQPSAPKLLQPKRFDRFSPGAAPQPPAKAENSAPAGQGNKSASKPTSKPASKLQPPAHPQPAHTERNPQP
jgi:rod shape-determining protein MreC